MFDEQLLFQNVNHLVALERSVTVLHFVVFTKVIQRKKGDK